MTIVVVADENLKTELLAQTIDEYAQINWLTNIQQLSNYAGAEAGIDLLFHNDHKRIDILERSIPKPILVNEVVATYKELPDGFIRINGWNTFLKRPVVEAANRDENLRIKAEEIFSLFNKKIEWIADTPGLISARVIATIINEAYFALSEKISTKEEIDIAMKLGTNYPYGPFEWSEKIGLKNIYDLLSTISKTNKRYQPCDLLKNEAFP